MSNQSDRRYYMERARQSLELATRTPDPTVASIHLDFYERYLDRAGAPRPRPNLRVE